MNTAKMTSTPTSSPTVEPLRVEGAVAFSTLRGCAEPVNPYDGFSVCDYTGDDPAHVASRRNAVADMLGLDSAESLILPRQTHTANVAIVDRFDAGRQLPDIDALVTADEAIAIGVNTADCVPVVLSDDEAGVIAVVHSGWRGTVARITANAIEKMMTLGATPVNICAAMGPSICMDCFEVGDEVAQAFRQTFPDVGGIVTDSYAKPHISLGAAIAATLRECGVRDENISLPAHCSRCDSDRFFSARRLGIHSGRTLTVARLQR